MRNVSGNVKKIKRQVYMFNNFFQKILPFLGYMKKYCKAGEAAGGTII
jgi:hypothetical protein